ncbi:toxin-antitoxin system HicB family antitoxin [Serinicoccus kebangsaanensis]|uniref:toxin-antitoxin system HicB family antitoxin n=1 Tax=Serinicoccus kebangsaanensis TaxID=2602069 RepID=UPI00124F1733|nr:toxin-antitoxin system HicB family antitoxin [Serinicoccus kebangsaanensis]
MELQPYLTAVADDLGRATALADEPTQDVVRRIAPAIEPAVRLAIVQALSDAAATITSQLEESVVTLRMDGRDPVLEIRPLGGEVDATAPAAAPEAEAGPDDDGDGTLARVSLRLPDPLKQSAERSAADAGQSLNTWIVQTIRAATRTTSTTDRDRRATHHRSRRVTGWA